MAFDFNAVKNKNKVKHLNSKSYEKVIKHAEIKEPGKR